MVEIRDREVRICEATGCRVVMEYVGNSVRPEYITANGHPGWLCLHNAGEDEDEEAVKQFLLEQESR